MLSSKMGDGMPDIETLDRKLDQLLLSNAEVKQELKALHADHQQLKIDVTALPLKMYEKADGLYVRLARYSVLERTFYGFLTSVVLGVVGYGIKIVLST